METELEIRELEQIEQGLMVEGAEENSEAEEASPLSGLFANGFMSG